MPPEVRRLHKRHELIVQLTATRVVLAKIRDKVRFQVMLAVIIAGFLIGFLIGTR